MDNTFLLAFIGGILIGVAATVMLLLNGRITGISGILGGLINGSKDIGWRIIFLAGLVTGGGLYTFWLGHPPLVQIESSWIMLVAAGLFVGFGTRLGGGCTSGHGICGIARFSSRSVTATVLFMASGMLTIWFLRILGMVQ